MALTFATRHAHELRYVAAWNRWLRYDGTRWNFEDTLLAFDLARAICQERAAGYDGKAAAAIESAKTVAAVERLAKTDRRLAAAVDQWDIDPWLLQDDCATIDLRTGIARESDAANGTPHPIWDAFLQRVAPDPELRAFLKRYCGYATTGITSEHKFLFAYGTGANGKSTFINTIAAIFGNYATVADMGTFIATSSERHPTDLAKLRGARLVVA